MNNIEIEVMRAMAKGDKRVNMFSGATPNLNYYGFEVGDVFTLPTKYNVIEERVNNNPTQYIFVQTQDGRVCKFYPSQLFRKVCVFNEDGTPTGQRIIANGTASERARQFPSYYDVMEDLKGRTIKVNAIQRVLGNNMRTHTVYTFDLV